MSERTKQISNPAVVTLSEMVAECNAENVRLRREIERLKALPAVLLYNPHPDKVLLDKLERELFADHRLTVGYCIDAYEITSGLQVEASSATLRDAITILRDKKK